MNQRIRSGMILTTLTVTVGMALLSCGAAEPPLRLRGTSVVVAIAQDGIIVATDSRFVLYANNTDRPLAYVDGVGKAFPYGPHVVVTAGDVLIGTTFFAAAVIDAAEAGRVPEDPQAAFAQITEYLSSLSGGLEFMAGNAVFLAGHRGSVPVFCLSRRGAGGTQCVDSRGLASLNADQSLEGQRTAIAGLRMSRVAEIAEQAIVAYSRSNPTVSGGPVAILAVTPRSRTWLKPQERNWRSTRDFVDAYRRGEVPMTPYDGVTKAEVDQVIDRTPLNP